uniref:CD109 molecule n=1 Tax=Tetraodon nigroviridis TaxID=99883 RepID=H3CZE0_TETNG
QRHTQVLSRKHLGVCGGVILTLLFCFCSQEHPASYLLLAPGSLQPGLQTTLSVTILGSSPVLVSAGITHQNQMVAMNSVTVEGVCFSRGHVSMLGEIQRDESSHRSPYLLHVKGHVNEVEVFSNETELTFDPKCFSTFIQTDKPNYRPGQAVRMRVVSLGPDGRPNHSPVNVTVRDPRGNLLRQWLAVDGVHGVVSKEFQLSENPPVGQWSIVARVSDAVTEKHFSVAKDASPTFSVHIQAPKRVHRDQVLQGSVQAKYVYGKPVRGHVNLTFIYPPRWRLTSTFLSLLQIDGTADFTFDLLGYRHVEKSHLGMAFYDGNVDDESVTVLVHVTDQLTGLTCNSRTTVFVATSRYDLCFEGHPKMLKPSLSFVAMLKVSTYNKQPLSLEDRQKPVRVSVKQQKQQGWMEGVEEEEEMVAEEMELHVPADGIIPLSITLKNDTGILLIEAYFGDSHHSLQLYRGYSSPSHSYLQIQRPPTPAQVGSPVTLNIQSNFPVFQIRYLVKAGGQVVSAGAGAAPLSLLPEASWAPLACVLVYCLHPTGEVVNDQIELPVTPVTNNKVSLSWSRSVVEPGDQVVLRVTAEEPASLVGVLVVDKATQRGGSHNDLTLDSMLHKPELLDAYPIFQMGDPYSVFKTCDLVAMTDAMLQVPEHLLYLDALAEEELLHHQDEGSAMEEDEHLQEHFPETWIWKDVHTGHSVSSDIQVTVPDSLTTWVVSAFVVSENLGLGFAEAPVELTVLKDFFLSLNLPACVIRGEELLLEVVVFNYLPHQVEVTVTVAESHMFQFVFSDQGGLATPFVTHLFVESQGEASVHIPIRPLVLGEVPVSVEAKTSTASDSMVRTVVVKAEGLEQFFSSSLLLELSSQSSLAEHLSFSFPPDVVMGSQRASVTVVGDLLGPSISGLDHLIRMPHGCGEQNMINFAPNVYVLQYLSATGQADPETTARATAYMSTGYEQELTYQRADGSFSAFGDSDAAGSTWLSAFVLRCFLQARPFIGVDAQVLEGVAAWLSTQQGAGGRFEESGRVIHTELKGGLEGPVSLTAYVLIALMEDPDLSVSGALGFLETRLDLGISSNYSLSLVAYALALANSSRAPLALQELMGRAELKDGVPLWSSPEAGRSRSSWQPRSADIEMASYVLLSHHKLGLIAEGVKLMKWLSQQRNDRGGFRGTQDTVVALQALATLAALTSSHDIDLTVRVNTDEWVAAAVFHVDQDNYLLHQSQQIEAGEGLHLQVTAEGWGLALFQLNVFYNVWRVEPTRKRRDSQEPGAEPEAFRLSVELFDSDSHPAHLSICLSLVQGLALSATGMAIVEAGLLSGFVLPPDGIQTDDVVRKVETPPGKVIVYLDSVTTSEVCLSIPLMVQNKVAKVQEASVLVYDYYESTRRATQTYNS